MTQQCLKRYLRTITRPTSWTKSSPKPQASRLHLAMRGSALHSYPPLIVSAVEGGVVPSHPLSVPSSRCIGTIHLTLTTRTNLPAGYPGLENAAIRLWTRDVLAHLAKHPLVCLRSS